MAPKTSTGCVIDIDMFVVEHILIIDSHMDTHTTLLFEI